jgi:RNA polymerase-binding transcription factor DksA
MSDTRSTDVVAPRGARTDFLRVAMKRLLAERDAALARTGHVVVEREHQATTGSGETDFINVETEREVRAMLDARAIEAHEVVERALARIDDGTYGLCLCCGEPIDVERLLALPRVEYCIACKRSEAR